MRHHRLSLGAVPGIGASVIDWIAYGHALRSEKDTATTFGKGDVRGVIASESSNNAKEGGALVPTIAFGVPGSASMALILGAFLIHGLTPGPEMLTKHLDVTYTLVWSVALANVLGAGICFLFANQLAKVALVRIGILAPVVLAVVFRRRFPGVEAMGRHLCPVDLRFLRMGDEAHEMAEAAADLGFVLGNLVERYLFISVERYGAEWLTFPVVMIVIAITLYGVLRPILKGYFARPRTGETRGATFGFQRESLNPDLAFSFLVLALFVVCLAISSQWEFGAPAVPQVVGWSGLLFTTWLILAAMFVRPAQVQATGLLAGGPPGEAAPPPAKDVHFDIQADYGDLPVRTIFMRAGVYFGWLLFFFGAAALVGILPAMFLFLVGYMRFEGKESWSTTLAVAVPMGIFCYWLFHKILIVPWPQTVVGDMFPALRSSIWLNLF